MTAATSSGPLPGSASDPSTAAAVNTRSEASGLADGNGRRIALEPPAWDLMPPVETETVRRFRPS